MIQANELRIGNYIKGKPLSIPRMKIESDGVTKITGYGISVIESDTNNSIGFNPIPLTKAWLLKFGARTLVKLKDGYERFDIHGIHLSISPERDFFVEYVHQIPIKYVHTLQNYYFSIKQRELTLAS